MSVLPAELLKWNSLPNLTRRTQQEYSASCPKCGDSGHSGHDTPDRFRIFVGNRPRGWCRSCGFFEWADTNDSGRLTALELAEMQAERVRLAAVERQRVKEKIERLEEAAEWRGYHRCLIEVDSYRQLWRNAGISDQMQEYWELGYNPSLEYTWGDEIKSSPALTIPYFKGEHVINVQSRLLEPEDPSDKYRFTKGLPAPLYDPEKDESQPNGLVLLVEGAKKAMVSYLHLGARYRVIGMPSKALSRMQLDSLKDCEPIIIAIDPDAMFDGTIERNVNMLGKERVLVARLPDKIDDLFVRHGATPDQIDSFLKVSRTA